MTHLTLDEARRLWAAGQGLHERADESIAATLERTGWIRTLGGASAFVGLAARNATSSVAAVHEALGAGAIRVSPCVRGCIYLVPAEHQGLAISIADRISAKRFARDLEKAGTSADELAELGEAVLGALRDGPASTRGLSKQLGDAVRSLGDAGKKVGLTTTLPPALRQLEFAGHIERTPSDGRLDHESYDWSLPASPIEGLGRPDGELFADMAALYFRWAGPATRKEFAAWTGLNQTQAKAAIAAADLVEVEVEGIGEAYVTAGALDAMPDAVPRLSCLPAMDNWYALRETAAPLMRPEEHDLQLVPFGPGKLVNLRDISQPLSRTYSCEGRVAGVWDADPASGEIVRHLFEPLPATAEADREAGEAEARAIFETLGHTKVFSIDTDKRAAKRVAHLRTLA